MNKVLIIAEAGVNHNGSLNLAKKLVDVAFESGADAVKFQTFIAKKLVTPSAEKASYQKSNLSDGVSDQFTMLKKLELSFEEQKELFLYATKKGISIFSTAFDFESIDFLASMKVPFWKIPSGEIVNTPYLRKIGSYGMKIILSTGMSTLGDIEYALDTLEKAGTEREKITLLHCTTEYPAPFNEVNLSVLETLRRAFGVKVGYSDHTEGIAVPIAAVALGAEVIEKHFTLDKTMKGPDHAASIEPNDLKLMVNGIRQIEQAIGLGVKRPVSSEKGNMQAARKSIVASRNIKMGEVFSEGNLAVKRPGNGLSPRYWDLVIGKKAERAYREDELID